MQAQSPPAALDSWSCTARDRSDVIDLMQGMTESWNAGDGATYGELFTEDCDYVAFDGTHLKGREQNHRHHQALFETVLKGSRLVFEGEPQMRLLTPDIAVMHAMGSVLMSWQDRVTPNRRSNQTYVLVRGSEGGWKITAFHNTRYRPLRLPSGHMLRLVLMFMRLRKGDGRPGAVGPLSATCWEISDASFRAGTCLAVGHRPGHQRRCGALRVQDHSAHLGELSPGTWINTGTAFWAFVSTRPLTLIVLVSLVAIWWFDGPARSWWLAALGIVIIERIATFTYFIPTMIWLQQHSGMTLEVSFTLATWSFVNHVRHGLTIAAWLISLKALTLLSVGRGDVASP